MGFEKPKPLDLVKLSRAAIAPYVAASVGRLSNLYPHWLLLNVEIPFGIPSSRLIVMWLLQSQQSMSMGEIARAIDLTPRGITRIVDGLEADGLARRVDGEHDKRVKNVELTSKGRNFIDGATPQVFAAFNEIFSVLQKSEVIELVRLIEKLTDHMKSHIDIRNNLEESR